LQGSAVGQLNAGVEITLIFFGQETGRQHLAE
jgi:hypothetical protein